MPTSTCTCTCTSTAWLAAIYVPTATQWRPSTQAGDSAAASRTVCARWPTCRRGRLGCSSSSSSGVRIRHGLGVEEIFKGADKAREVYLAVAVVRLQQPVHSGREIYPDVREARPELPAVDAAAVQQADCGVDLLAQQATVSGAVSGRGGRPVQGIRLAVQASPLRGLRGGFEAGVGRQVIGAAAGAQQAASAAFSLQK